MPLIRMRAVKAEKISTVSRKLIDELEQLLQCPREYFTIEVLQSVFIRDGETVEGSPVVEVSWFDRGQETKDKAAEIITRYIQSAGYADVDVIFIPLDRSSYYENGEHF